MNIKNIVNGYLNTLGIKEVKNLHDIDNLQKKHLEKLSFSSIKVLLNEDISLDLKDIYKSLVIEKRGGYCFEHNKLIFEVLKYLGFDVQNILSRIILDRDAIPPKTHRFTILHFGGKKYVLDVGIGSHAPYSLVEFGKNKTKNSYGAIFEVVEEDDGFYTTHRIAKGDNPFKIQHFRLGEYYECDLEVGNFYSYKHKDAVFVNNLVASRFCKNKILSVTNKTFSKIYKDKIEKKEIKNHKKLYKIIKNKLDLNFSKEEIKKVFNSKKFIK